MTGEKLLLIRETVASTVLELLPYCLDNNVSVLVTSRSHKELGFLQGLHFRLIRGGNHLQVNLQILLCNIVEGIDDSLSEYVGAGYDRVGLVEDLLVGRNDSWLLFQQKLLNSIILLGCHNVAGSSDK